MTAKRAIRSSGAPAPAHSFSQGVRTGPFIQVSGQGPVDAASGEYLHPGDVAAQTRLVLEHVTAVVEAGGGTVDDLVMLRVYLADRACFAAMNEAYAAFLAERSTDGVLPARTTVITGLPHPDMLVEIDGLAIVE